MCVPFLFALLRFGGFRQHHEFGGAHGRDQEPTFIRYVMQLTDVV
jgi:hypothetical protein